MGFEQRLTHLKGYKLGVKAGDRLPSRSGELGRYMPTTAACCHPRFAKFSTFSYVEELGFLQLSAIITFYSLHRENNHTMPNAFIHARSDGAAAG